MLIFLIDTHFSNFSDLLTNVQIFDFCLSEKRRPTTYVETHFSELPDLQNRRNVGVQQGPIPILRQFGELWVYNEQHYPFL